MSSSTHPAVDVEHLIFLTVPELIEYRFRNNPNDVFTLFPGERIGDEPSPIKYLEFGRAVQRFARAIQADYNLKEGDVVGVIANCDALLYITAIAGLLHTGVTVFPISPRNSGAAVNSMLRKVDAHKMMIASSSVLPLINEVKSELAVDDYHLDVLQIPSFSDVYPRLASETEADPFDPFPFKSRNALVGKIALYIHSSGSTGFPKPIPWTTEYINRFLHSVLLREMMTLPSGTVMASPGIPSFHAMGVMLYMLLPLMTLTTGGMFRPKYPHSPQTSSPQTILQALQAIKANATVMIPSILEELSHDDSAVSYLRSLTYIGYGGGPLSKAIGDKLAKAGCHIRVAYGSTEVGIVGSFFPPSLATNEDWEWLEFGDNVKIDWAWQADGSAELRVIPCATHVPAVQNMPGPEGGYATNDLWVPHPTKPNLWKIVGRVDDVLILANGEKVVPGPTEGALLVHPMVHSAVMFGRERTQVGILVEPVESHAFDPTDESALATFRNAIWTTIEEANSTLPAFGRIYKEMILVTHPSKPLPRAAKGTVNRKAAIRDYEPEINRIYEAVERPAQGSSVTPPVQWTTTDISSWLHQLASSIREGVDIKIDVDLFKQGFDSLSATFLRNNITAALRSSPDASVAGSATKIGPNFIYNQPVLQDMAVAIVALLRPNAVVEEEDPVTVVHSLIKCYTQDMSTVKPSSQPKPAREVVLLTGSTGGLGSQLLVGLLEADKVAKVYALNRASSHSSSLTRHEDTFRDRGLDIGLLQSPKVVFLEGDTSAEGFGLPADQYQELQTSITVIIHNAWQLNFNLGIKAFESHVHGTRRLVDLAFASPHPEHIRFLFTSSVGVTQSWPSERGAFPEEPQDDARWCIGSGYGEAKYVAEQILVKAANNGLQTTSFRIGQISGGYANGAWATTDWVPIMLASAVSLGSLPDAMGVASWVPTDVISQTVVDVALASEAPARALNVVHPHPVLWSTIMEAVADVFIEEGITASRLPLVPLQDWVGKLSNLSANADADTFERVPALKLIAFFGGLAHADASIRSSGGDQVEAGGMAQLSTEKSQRFSPALRDALPLRVADVRRWVRYWVEKGLLVSGR